MGSKHTQTSHTSFVLVDAEELQESKLDDLRPSLFFHQTQFSSFMAKLMHKKSSSSSVDTS